MEQFDIESSLAIQRGDPDKWRSVLARMIPRLYAMFLRKGINHSLAEELVQGTVFDAVRGRSGFAPDRGNIEQWIMGIAGNNLALEMRRRQSRPKVNSDLLKHIQALDAEAFPDELLEKKETALLVRQALGQLDEKERLVLQSKYLDDMPVRRIAERMNTTQKAVHSLLYRARAALRKKLIQLAPLLPEERKL